MIRKPEHNPHFATDNLTGYYYRLKNDFISGIKRPARFIVDQLCALSQNSDNYDQDIVYTREMLWLNRPASFTGIQREPSRRFFNSGRRLVQT